MFGVFLLLVGVLWFKIWNYSLRNSPDFIRYEMHPPWLWRLTVFAGLALLLTTVLTACGTLAQSPSQQAGTNGLPFILITAAPNASPTPTAFLPPAAGQATPTSLYYANIPTLEPSLPTATAAPTEEPASQPTPTVDVAALFPSSAAPPLPDGVCLRVRP